MKNTTAINMKCGKCKKSIISNIVWENHFSYPIVLDKFNINEELLSECDDTLICGCGSNKLYSLCCEKSDPWSLAKRYKQAELPKEWVINRIILYIGFMYFCSSCSGKQDGTWCQLSESDIDEYIGFDRIIHWLCTDNEYIINGIKVIPIEEYYFKKLFWRNTTKKWEMGTGWLSDLNPNDLNIGKLCFEYDLYELVEAIKDIIEMENIASEDNYRFCEYCGQEVYSEACENCNSLY